MGGSSFGEVENCALCAFCGCHQDFVRGSLKPATNGLSAWPNLQLDYQALDLVTRARSKLVIAQYRVDSPRGEVCRERAFVLEGEKISPVTNTRRTCTQY